MNLQTQKKDRRLFTILCILFKSTMGKNVAYYIILGFFVLSWKSMKNHINDANIHLTTTDFKESDSHNKSDSTAMFIFLIGAEGSGHQIYTRLFENSPLRQSFEISKHHPSKTTGLTKALFDHNTRKVRLWSEPCGQFGGDTEKFGNPTAALKEFSQLLKKFNRRVKNSTLQQQYISQNIVTAVPLNSLRYTSSAVIAYPPGGGSCRMKQIPSLNTLYSACKMANVRCSHIYQYRDPYYLIRVALFRKTDNTEGHINTVISILKIINSQLSSHSDRLLGCWNYDKSSEEMLSILRKIFTYSNKTEFRYLYDELFNNLTIWYGPPISEESKLKMISKRFNESMVELVKLHNKTKDLCHQQWNNNTQNSESVLV